MRASRDRRLLQLLGGVALVAGCSRLTDVDWSRIPSGDGNEGGAGATDSGGTAGEPNGGTSIAGSASGGDAGAPVGGEAGEAGSDSGGSSSGSGGTGGFGGFGGFAGFGGVSGSSGSGGMSGSGGSGGMSGTAGTGGGLSEDPDPCTGTTSPVVATDLVLFDGGHGKENTAWGGRVGLDAACEAALAKLSLPQTKTHAFITVDGVDSIHQWTKEAQYPDISDTARVVGPTGIQISADFATLIKGTGIDQSLVCAGVVAATDRTWLTGATASSCVGTPPNPVTCFTGSPMDSCVGWTLGVYHPQNQARWGYTIYKDKRWGEGDSAVAPNFAKVACNVATDNILCMAYTPE